jgi:hypothetical protein
VDANPPPSSPQRPNGGYLAGNVTDGYGSKLRGNSVDCPSLWHDAFADRASLPEPSAAPEGQVHRSRERSRPLTPARLMNQDARNPEAAFKAPHRGGSTYSRLGRALCAGDPFCWSPFLFSPWPLKPKSTQTSRRAPAERSPSFCSDHVPAEPAWVTFPNSVCAVSALAAAPLPAKTPNLVAGS